MEKRKSGSKGRVVIKRYGKNSKVEEVLLRIINQYLGDCGGS